MKISLQSSEQFYKYTWLFSILNSRTILNSPGVSLSRYDFRWAFDIFIRYMPWERNLIFVIFSAWQESDYRLPWDAGILYDSIN